MADEIFRYYKIGAALVKAKYNNLGIKATYKLDSATKDFIIDNSFIEDIIKDEDLKVLRKEEFDNLVAKACK